MLYTVGSELVQSILEATLRDGGATFTTDGNQSGAPFYAVSVYPERGQIVHDVPTLADVQWYLDQNADILDEHNAVGTWLHDGACYLDVSRLVADRDEALALGARYGQLAIFNLATFEEIPVREPVAVAA
jgi:hypothetical protein